LPPVLGAPPFDKTHADRAHASELVDGFESLTHALRQQFGEFLILEYLQIAAGRNFAHRRRMPAVTLVAIGRLDEYRRIRQTLGEYFAADVIQSHAFANVTSRLLNHRVSIHVRQQAQTETLGIARICVDYSTYMDKIHFCKLKGFVFTENNSETRHECFLTLFRISIRHFRKN
jgi:hypothetical protein